MIAMHQYLRELNDRMGQAWNRFWFTPVDILVVAVLRIVVGIMALVYLLAFTPDLVTWFGPNGLLPLDMIRDLTVDDEGPWNGRMSYLYFVDEPPLLWGAHVISIVVVAAFAAGFAARVTGVLSLIVVLSYVHRAPMITGQFEPVLTFMLCYLVLAPTGRALSFDKWRRRRKSPAHHPPANETSVAANVAVRLIQVHLAAFYLMMGLTKLGGSDTWWAGEAVWWLIAHAESRLVNLTGLHPWEYLINFWTHAIVLFELAFGLLVWKKIARPLLLVMAVVHWLLVGLVTGLLGFAVMMLAANLAFVTPEAWRLVAARLPDPSMNR